MSCFKIIYLSLFHEVKSFINLIYLVPTGFFFQYIFLVPEKLFFSCKCKIRIHAFSEYPSEHFFSYKNLNFQFKLGVNNVFLQNAAESCWLCLSADFQNQTKKSIQIGLSCLLPSFFAIQTGNLIVCCYNFGLILAFIASN